jgi:hypothetical protein
MHFQHGPGLVRLSSSPGLRACWGVRFGLMSFPGDGMEVEADARLAVEAGFDTIATGDHLRHPRDPVLPLLDGWSVLTWRCIADPEGNEFCIWTQPAT